MNAAVALPVQHYRDAFAMLEPQLGVAAAERTAALEHFTRLGFPSPREETWKYTSLRRLESRRFTPRLGEASSAGMPPPLAGHRLVVIDGRWQPELSTPVAAISGLRLRTLEQAIGDGEPVGALLRVPTGGGTERFAALNAALCPDVLVLDVEPGATPDAVEIVMVATGSDAGMTHPRLLVRLGRGATARLVIRYAGDDTERLVTAVCDVSVGPDATLHLYRLLDSGARSFHIECIEATVGQRGALHVHDAQLGAGLGRLDLNARLAAPGAAAELTGLFLADGSRHLDTHVRVDHLAPATRSLQDYRGIAAHRGRGVFNCKAVVHEGAQQSNARQSSRNLLLTPGAEIDTKPELEIYTDDVQCGHGATTGQLDPAALFYLRSRGLSEVEARSALTRAFAGAVLSRMDHAPFAAAVHARLEARLGSLLEEQP